MNTSTKLNIAELIKRDVEECRTPDLPQLRYNNGAIKVFLWDDLQDFKTLSTWLFNVDLINGYRGVASSAQTVEKYLPWYNINDRQDGMMYPAMCLEDPVDIEMTDLDDYSLGDLLPIGGKLVDVSVDTMCKLDQYYENGFNFTRHLIEVKPFKSSTKTIKAYTWFNSLEDMFIYDPHENTYKLHKDLDLTPFVEEKGVYQMGGIK